MNQEQKDLVQAAVDGELTPEEQERFDTLLGASVEARTLYDDLKRLGDFIEGIPPVEPPASLHAQITQQIELPRQTGAASWLRFDALPGFLRYGLAGAAAVVLTVAVYQGGSQLDPSLGTEDLLGTIASRGEMAGGSEIDSYRFEGPGSGGDVRLLARDANYALVFDLALDEPTEVEVVLPGSGFRVDAFARETEDPESSVSWSANRLSASINGEQRFVVRVSRLPGHEGDNGDIAVRLLRGGELVQEGSVTTSSQ